MFQTTNQYIILYENDHRASMLIEMRQSITRGSTVAQATFKGSHLSSFENDLKHRHK